MSFRFLVSVVLLLAASPVGACGPAPAGHYAWALSWSEERPDSSVAPVLQGVARVYLWLTDAPSGGFSAAELDVSGSLLVTGFEPREGVLNIGAPRRPKFAVGGCPEPPFLAGAITVAGLGEEGDVCLGEQRVTVDCAEQPLRHPSAVRGCVAGSGEPCHREAVPPAPPDAGDTAEP